MHELKPHHLLVRLAQHTERGLRRVRHVGLVDQSRRRVDEKHSLLHTPKPDDATAQGGGMSCMRKLTLVASAEDLDKASSHHSAIIAGRWSPRLIWLYRAKVLVELAGVRQARK